MNGSNTQSDIFLRSVCRIGTPKAWPKPTFQTDDLHGPLLPCKHWNFSWLVCTKATHMIKHWVTSWWFQPLWKIWKSVGMMIKFHGSSHHQPDKHWVISNDPTHQLISVYFWWFNQFTPASASAFSNITFSSFRSWNPSSPTNQDGSKRGQHKRSKLKKGTKKATLHIQSGAPPVRVG